MDNLVNSGVFALEEVTDELAIVKVLADDPLTVARHPFVSGDMAYISVTRGVTRIYTIVYKDGTTESVSRGAGVRHRVCNAKIDRLKPIVDDFLIGCGVYPNLEGTPDSDHVEIVEVAPGGEAGLWDLKFYSSPDRYCGGTKVSADSLEEVFDRHLVRIDGRYAGLEGQLETPYVGNYWWRIDLPGKDGGGEA